MEENLRFQLKADNQKASLWSVRLKMDIKGVLYFRRKGNIVWVVHEFSEEPYKPLEGSSENWKKIFSIQSNHMGVLIKTVNPAYIFSCQTYPY